MRPTWKNSALLCPKLKHNNIYTYQHEETTSNNEKMVLSCLDSNEKSGWWNPILWQMRNIRKICQVNACRQSISYKETIKFSPLFHLIFSKLLLYKYIAVVRNNLTRQQFRQATYLARLLILEHYRPRNILTIFTSLIIVLLGWIPVDVKFVERMYYNYMVTYRDW